MLQGKEGETEFFSPSGQVDISVKHRSHYGERKENMPLDLRDLVPPCRLP
jgi:hypothetical protein